MLLNFMLYCTVHYKLFHTVLQSHGAKLQLGQGCCTKIIIDNNSGLESITKEFTYLGSCTRHPNRSLSSSKSGKPEAWLSQIST